jgi:hypothetical protein
VTRVDSRRDRDADGDRDPDRGSLDRTAAGPRLLTVTGRDVLFAHWPFEAADLAPLLPDPLDVETHDGSAWVSVLGLENTGIAPGTLPVPAGLRRGVPQLNLRTYVRAGGRSGVYFLSLDAGERAAAAVGRRAFGLPFHHARMRVTRSGEAVSFRSRRDGSDPPAVFGARYRPDGPTYRADPGTVEAFAVEHFTYLLPAPEDRRLDALAPGDDRDRAGTGAGDLLVGTIEREPWALRPVEASIRTNSLFAAAGLPDPAGDPAVQYSPGFEMAVRPVERLSADRTPRDA